MSLLCAVKKVQFRLSVRFLRPAATFPNRLPSTQSVLYAAFGRSTANWQTQEVKDWWDKLDPRWASIRLEALDLLKREQRLEQIVRLIGPDALPDTDRLVLVVAEMIKNGFLQQNAFDDIDVYSVPEKQILILQLMMSFYKKSLSLIKQGAPLLKLTALSIREELVRIKTSIPNDKTDDIRDIEKRMDDEFASIERVYRKVETV